jgi:hypothetical protein
LSISSVHRHAGGFPPERYPLGGGAGCYCGWNRGPPLLEAGPAEHGTTLCGLKGNGSFGGAFRTDCPSFCANAGSSAGHALDLALFAALWIVFELLVVKEKLFASGEDKVVTAIRTFQNLVDEVHTRPPEHALEIFQYSADEALSWRRFTSQLIRLLIRQLSSHSPTWE